MEIPLKEYAQRASTIRNILAGKSLPDTVAADLNKELDTMISILGGVVEDMRSVQGELGERINRTTRGTGEASEIKVRQVKTLAEVEEVPIFYVSELKAYAFNVAGVLLYGNLCDVLRAADAKLQGIVSFIPCRYGASCPKLQANAVCRYCHDPLEVNRLRKQGFIDAKTEGKMLRPPAILSTSWLYLRNRFGSFWGSRETIKQDAILYKAKLSEAKDTRALHQKLLMHELLALLSVELQQPLL
jgi:hypothetical protein